MMQTTIKQILRRVSLRNGRASNAFVYTNLKTQQERTNTRLVKGQPLTPRAKASIIRLTRIKRIIEKPLQEIQEQRNQ